MKYKHANSGLILINKGQIDFKDAWDFQETLFRQITEIKLANRSRTEQQATPNYLLVCEHPPVYTLGKSGSDTNMLLSEDKLREIGASFYKINRGGDITHHGPGQIVIYPILDLENFFTDIHLYLRKLEEAVINTLRTFHISAGRYPGYTGVWIEPESINARKICAMGVKCGRWVTMHGLALNVNNELDYFNNIVPCGISDKKVTSMKKESADKQLNIEEVTERLVAEIAIELEAEIRIDG